jgi:hypothetical protein
MFATPGPTVPVQIEGLPEIQEYPMDAKTPLTSCRMSKKLTDLSLYISS